MTWEIYKNIVTGTNIILLFLGPYGVQLYSQLQLPKFCTAEQYRTDELLVVGQTLDPMINGTILQQAEISGGNTEQTEHITKP
jgi:hypothetical protein